MTWSNPYQRAALLIRAAGWLVPSSSRLQWSQEWTTELHYALRTLRERGEDSEAGARLIDFASGAFQDAAWHRGHYWKCKWIERSVSRSLQSAGFCLAGLLALVLVIVTMSGFLPVTRSVLWSLPYADANRIATVVNGAPIVAVRSGIPGEWVVGGSRTVV